MMGCEQFWTGGKRLKCPRCNKNFYKLKLVIDEFICEECFQRLGGKEYIKIYEELK
jgi:hypothetical protein